MRTSHVRVWPLVCGGLVTGVAAQHVKQAAPIRGPIRDAGVYHVASGTWTRDDRAARGIAPRVCFNDDASSGLFGVMPSSETWFGTGRLPGTSDPSLPNVSTDVYWIDGFQIGYCNSEGPAGVAITLSAYEKLLSCVDPLGQPLAVQATLGGLPGSSAPGVQACWIVTIDLAGTTLVTPIAGEGGDEYDGVLDEDTGGIGFSFVSTAGGYAGPILAGDPRNFPYGDGTYYQNPTAPGSGLGIQDQFYLLDSTGALANGCYWFGGYFQGHPFASSWLRLFAEQEDQPCLSVCQSNPSSAGAGARIELGAIASGSWTFVAAPVPDQPGIFFHGPSSIRVPFGDGYLCAGGGIVRLLPPVVAVGHVAEVSVDITGLSGMRYFQYWFRDPAGGGASFNTSDAICCEFGG